MTTTQEPRQHKSTLKKTLVVAVIFLMLFFAYCIAIGTEMSNSQHDVAAQFFLRALHPKLVEFKQQHGRWLPKAQIGKCPVLSAQDGAGGLMNPDDLDTLWSECILYEPRMPNEPVAVIPSSASINGLSCSNVLCADGDVCTQPLERYYREKR